MNFIEINAHSAVQPPTQSCIRNLPCITIERQWHILIFLFSLSLSLSSCIKIMSLQDGGYTQGQLTFIDPDGLYGADTQGLDYGFELTPLSQSQTQSSQLTQPNGGPGVAVDRKITKGKKDYEDYNNNTNNGFIY